MKIEINAREKDLDLGECGGRGGGLWRGIWKIVRTTGKILATPSKSVAEGDQVPYVLSNGLLNKRKLMNLIVLP